MKAAPRRPTRTYARIVLGVVAFCAVLVGVTNTTVNPWRVTPVPWQAKGLEPYRGEGDRLRTRKAGLLCSGDYKVALVGSSRTANGFDPVLLAWGRDDVVNLGCSAAFLHESTGIASYFVDHEPAELLLLGIDPGDLTSPVDTRPMFDFTSSPFAPDSGADHELRYIFGLSTFDASRKTLADAMAGRTGEYGPRGMRRKPKELKQGLIKFIATTLVAKTELGTADTGGPGRPLNEDKLHKLRDLLEKCQRRGVRVILFFQSNHALMHAEAAHIGSGVVPFEKERWILVELVDGLNATALARSPETAPIELWDFCNYHPLHCEPLPLDDPKAGRMTNWRDLGHFTPEVGETMLSLMLGWPLPRPEWKDIGRKLDTGNLDAYLSEVGEGYQRYLTRDGARDLAWKEETKARARR